MQIKVIGDLHGESYWKDILTDTINNYDYIIFLGDYVDSFIISSKDINNNLIDLIKFKQTYSDKIILLWGNHDVQYRYLNKPIFKCSGFRSQDQFILNNIFTKYHNCFQLSFQIKDWLFTHAGLNKQFLDFLHNRFKQTIKIKDNNYSIYLNALFNANPDNFSLVSYFRGGSSKFGSPLWMDLLEYTSDNKLPINQVVGHQPVRKYYTDINNKYKTIWIDTNSHPESNIISNLNLDI